MSLAFAIFEDKSRLRALLDHFSIVDDPRDVRRVAHPLAEVLLLVVCGTMADCDDYDAIAAWGEAHLPFLRRYLPYHFGAPCGRWLTLLMNRINPALFSAAFTAWVRASWPERPDLVAIDGKTSRRSHDRASGKASLHLVSAFATTSRLVLGQEAVAGKNNELSAIPVLIDRLAEGGGLKGALVSIDAIATNATIAQAIEDAGADYLLAVKANQPTLRAETESLFAAADPERLDVDDDHDKGHGRIERRTVSVVKEVDWLDGDRRFPGELRLPLAATIVRVRSRAELSDRCRMETRYYISSATLDAKQAAEAVRGHWRIENELHWVMDVVFKDDQSRLRKGHGALNMAVVRHFAVNLVRQAPEPIRPKPLKPQLLDRRLGKASGKRVPVDREAAVEALYRSRYSGFTAKHFHEILVRDHRLTWGYTWTKTFLHSKGLLEKAKKRGAHRRKRPRRPLPGMMLHQDGSRREWLGGQPALDLIVTMDDATNAVYSTFLVEEEGRDSTFRALNEVLGAHGLPLSLYTDRGSHYFHTPEAGGKVDRTRLTQVGHALDRLGVEHIAAYSPQARGRSERVFHTLQDRLTKELALAGIRDVETANVFLRDVYTPAHNARFAVEAEQEGSAFVAVSGADLGEILCVQEERQVGNDNCVAFNRLKLQIPASPLRPHFVKARVKVRQYHDGTRCLPRPALPRSLRPQRRPGGALDSRLNPLGGKPVDGMDKPAACPPRPQQNKSRSSGHALASIHAGRLVRSRE